MAQHEQLRLVNWRLKILREADEAPRCVAFVCRRYGISRKTFYKWKKRYAEHGMSGLRDRHHAPFHCPRATHPEIVQKVLYLRQHYGFGPWRIRMYLHRYHTSSLPIRRFIASCGATTSIAYHRTSGLSRTNNAGGATRSLCPATGFRLMPNS